MKIVVLDGYTLNPGDNPWSEVAGLGELTVHERTPPDLIIERSLGAEIILTNKTPLSESTLRQLPDLKFISVLATGYNVVDTQACETLGISVSNVPEYGTQAVAQYVFALILELAHHVGQHAQSVRTGGWGRSGDFSYWETSQRELAGSTLGIVGYGRIGSHVAQIGRAFGMRVLAHTRTPREISGVTNCSLNELLQTADVVSLHCPSTPETQGIINAERLGLMKSSAFLINTARGDLICEQDLARALEQDTIAGAALDVVSSEPVRPDNPLLAAPRCIITPHMAWSALQARQRLMKTTADNIAAFQKNAPQNLVTAAKA